MRAQPNPAKQVRGFTLIEVMITMAIIIVVVTAALPNILGSQKDKPLVDATNSAMQLAQFAKSRAVNDFNAYGLQVISYSGSTLGRLAVYPGNGPQCSGLVVDGSVEPIKTYDLKDAFRGSGGVPVEIRLTQVVPSTLKVICFTPDGRVVDAATNQPVPSDLSAEYAAGDAVLVLQRFVDGVSEGFPHNVLIPYSGKPRWTYGEDVDSALGEGESAGGG